MLFGTSSLADEESFVSAATSILFAFKVKSDDRCRVETIDSSVAGVSTNMSENISFKTINDYESLPQNDMLRFTLPSLEARV